MKELVAKLAKIQKELKAPKGQVNKFGGYKYRNCEDILEAVKPLLGDLILRIEDDIVEVGERFYVKAEAWLYDGENSIVTRAYAREPLSKKGMDESQVTGAASSYARKYALNGLFCIDDTKDADSHDNRESGAGSKTPLSQSSSSSSVISEMQRKRLMAIATNGKLTDAQMKDIIKKHGFASSKEITKAKYTAICEEASKLGGSNG